MGSSALVCEKEGASLRPSQGSSSPWFFCSKQWAGSGDFSLSMGPGPDHRAGHPVPFILVFANSHWHVWLNAFSQGGRHLLGQYCGGQEDLLILGHCGFLCICITLRFTTGEPVTLLL